MPFSYPATELFDKKGNRRVVFSEEEHGQAVAAGFSFEENPKTESK